MILVFVETDASGATEVSREAVTFARTLSASGGGVPIDAVLVGDAAADLPGVVEQLGRYGVRRVHHVTGDGFLAYSLDSEPLRCSPTSGSFPIRAAAPPHLTKPVRRRTGDRDPRRDAHALIGAGL